MKTSHVVNYKDCSKVQDWEAPPVDLIVTSPPYPGVKMWDELFSPAGTEITRASWAEGIAAIARHLLRLVDFYMNPGGVLCVNIGDAVRSVDGSFQLLSNHARVSFDLTRAGLIQLPGVIWKKVGNSPNSFLGSGLMPPKAYVTLGHEHILIFRIQGKIDGEMNPEIRRASGFFFNERNEWCSDIWDVRGTRQDAPDVTWRRSGAYPLEIPLRCIALHSLIGGTVLDPYLGTGTTTVAAAALCRSSVGFEIDTRFRDIIRKRMSTLPMTCEAINRSRLEQGRCEESEIYHPVYNIPVKSRQETEIRFPVALSSEMIESDDARDKWIVTYEWPRYSSPSSASI